jgi:coenzyme F420-reducing hydrogenase delta subunit
MKTTKMLKMRHTLVAALLAFIVLHSMFPTEIDALTSQQGNNIVWCNGPSTCSSTAFIDASAFTPSTDPCAQINAALNTAAGNSLTDPVIDARGLPSGTCNTNPFSNINIPSTVLLPVGTLTTTVQWTLPSGTKIIGAGVGLTTLIAATGVSPLISMGGTPCSANNPCTGVGVQDLSLSQTNSNSIAIDNEYSQDLSYVQRVAIFVGTSNSVIGLQIGQYAQNSAYSDIVFNAQQNNEKPSSGPTCVWVTQPATGIRIRGLSCVGDVNYAAAVVLDGSNDSIEDVYISNAYADGILVGNDNPDQCHWRRKQYCSCLRSQRRKWVVHQFGLRSHRFKPARDFERHGNG